MTKGFLLEELKEDGGRRSRGHSSRRRDWIGRLGPHPLVLPAVSRTQTPSNGQLEDNERTQLGKI